MNDILFIRFRKQLDELKHLIDNSIGSKFSESLLKTVERILNSPNIKQIENNIWHDYLDLTRLPNFLESLDNIQFRYRWAETTFKIIKASDYSILNLIEQRVRHHGEKTLFVTIEGEVKNEHSYRLIDTRIKKIATAFLYVTNYKPKVAIYSDNSIDSACSDLACLAYDIHVSPLNTQFNLDTLKFIHSKINFNIIVTDTDQRLEMLKTLREKHNLQFEIFFTGSLSSQNEEGVIQLDQILSLISHKDIAGVLSKREKLKLDDISTIMFTSGSTGMPKGVAFTNYNLITKRFARAAALPKVGRNEVLLCYLPLFHTFGRYLEMLGTIFWGGTYVFAGRNDADSLLALMKIIQPTGFISIPLRWREIYERFQNTSEHINTKKSKRDHQFREFIGHNLRWGLSAAGYLEPKVFKFFNNHKVELCSGFGMTEATGGISMTLPGEYIKDSVGIPLPGIEITFSKENELQIAGHYVAKYLDGTQRKDDKSKWLSTGDLFKQDEQGYLYIIDRVKDIYKNIKGQTIAPAYIEKKLENIPGLKRAFLVGDMKPYNTLLIVPDYGDNFIKKAEAQNKLMDYFSSIISTVNSGLIPYERILKFSLLHRNFVESNGELTAKGTFRRKVIELNFKNEIDELYKKSQLEFRINNLRITIPLWVLKDLGITKEDFEYKNKGIYDKHRKIFLTIVKITNSNRIQIGSFEYVVKTNHIDLGIFVLQPILWVGNYNLINFAKCKDNWDIDFPNISSQIYVNKEINKGNILAENLSNTNHLDLKLKKLNIIIVKALFGKEKEVLQALHSLEELLKYSEHKIENLVSRRLEVLAVHTKFSVRSLAYKILLFNQPSIDFDRYLPSFINSGLPFLNRKAIEEISYSKIEGFRLYSLSMRMESYRKGLTWPVSETALTQFKRILDMLVKFVTNNPSAYPPVRAELINWILHKQDIRISKYAKHLFKSLSSWYESRIKLTPFEKQSTNWIKKIIYQDIISNIEKERIEKILITSTFLKEAFMLIFENHKFDLNEVPDQGIYISSISSSNKRYLYRISINTNNYKHYDFVIFIKPDITKQKVLETIYLTIKIAHTSGKTSILPKLGNFRSNLGVVSFDFINDLTIWEKIRQLTSTRSIGNKNDFKTEWEILFKRGIAAFFTVLKRSDYSVIPGNISPTNVVVPEPYFKEGTKVLSISGWHVYQYPEDLILPVLNNFYSQTFNHYPWSKEYLNIEWTFDACLEALGYEEGIAFLKKLKNKFLSSGLWIGNTDLLPILKIYIDKAKNEPYIDSYLKNAFKNYEDWLSLNSGSTKRAKADFVQNLFSLYRFEKYPEIVRYIFYSRTYFSDISEEVSALFTKLINTLFKHPDLPAIKRIELLELQELLNDKTDKVVLNKLIFPKLTEDLKIEIASGSENNEDNLILKTKAKDSLGLSYIIRKPLSPSEIGSLHKLFIVDNYPLKIDNDLKYLIITDQEDEENIIGGICYKLLYLKIAHIEGIEIAKSYRGRGLAGKLIQDFSERLFADGIKTVTTHYYLKSFFEKFNFKMDSRYGGLVKFLKY